VTLAIELVMDEHAVQPLFSAFEGSPRCAAPQNLQTSKRGQIIAKRRVCLFAHNSSSPSAWW
jgi:hypothetical protein